MNKSVYFIKNDANQYSSVNFSTMEYRTECIERASHFHNYESAKRIAAILGPKFSVTKGLKEVA